MRDTLNWQVFLVFETNKLVALIGSGAHDSLGLLGNGLSAPGWNVALYDLSLLSWFTHQYSQGMLSIYDIHSKDNITCA